MIEAFNGDAPLALERNSLLTASSLQNYLKVAVPRTLMVDYTDKKEQTPWCFGANSGEFLLADLQDILIRRKAAAMPPGVEVTQLSLLRKEIGTVRQLSGFHKGHYVPDAVTGATEAFVAKIAADELDQDLKEMHERLIELVRLQAIGRSCGWPRRWQRYDHHAIFYIHGRCATQS